MEPNYFIRDTEMATRFTKQTEEEYLALFSEAGSVRHIGERSVSYIYSSEAARRILAFQPDAKVLIMLRNPADQIRSLHWNCVRSLNEDVTDLADALEAESERREGRRLPATAARPHILQYRQAASCAGPLEAWLNILGRDRIHVIVFDEFAQDTALVHRQVLEFLGVDHTVAVDHQIHNRGEPAGGIGLRRFLVRHPAIRASLRALVPGKARAGIAERLGRMTTQSRPPMSDDLRRQLLTEFEPQVEKLESLLGKNLSAWKPASLPPHPSVSSGPS